MSGPSKQTNLFVTPDHPAKYTKSFLPLFAQMLGGCQNVLDPFAGTCRIVGIRKYGFAGEIYCNELEPEWAELGRGQAVITVGDAEHLPYGDNFFDAIVTSPTYSNRMADHHRARDGSRRNTYTHALGHKLSPGNTGAMQWGEEYRDKHRRVWAECRRVLKPGGVFILNISDHFRKGKWIHVTDWHVTCLESLGFELQDHVQIKTPRQRNGQNGDLRVPYESISKLVLHK